MDPRPVVDASDQQIGEQRVTAAGGSITQGADPALLGRALADMQQFLREYTFHVDQERETTLREIRHELKLLRGDRDVITGALGTLRERLDGLVSDRERDHHERRRRQAVLNIWLGAICLGVAILAVAVGWLAWRELVPPIDPAALLRLWGGAAIALGARIWTGRPSSPPWPQP